MLTESREECSSRVFDIFPCSEWLSEIRRCEGTTISEIHFPISIRIVRHRHYPTLHTFLQTLPPCLPCRITELRLLIDILRLRYIVLSRDLRQLLSGTRTTESREWSGEIRRGDGTPSRESDISELITSEICVFPISESSEIDEIRPLRPSDEGIYREGILRELRTDRGGCTSGCGSSDHLLSRERFLSLSYSRIRLTGESRSRSRITPLRVEDESRRRSGSDPGEIEARPSYPDRQIIRTDRVVTITEDTSPQRPAPAMTNCEAGIPPLCCGCD